MFLIVSITDEYEFAVLTLVVSAARTGVTKEVDSTTVARPKDNHFFMLFIEKPLSNFVLSNPR